MRGFLLGRVVIITMRVAEKVVVFFNFLSFRCVDNGNTTFCSIWQSFHIGAAARGDAVKLALASCQWQFNYVYKPSSTPLSLSLPPLDYHSCRSAGSFFPPVWTDYRTHNEHATSAHDYNVRTSSGGSPFRVGSPDGWTPGPPGPPHRTRQTVYVIQPQHLTTVTTTAISYRKHSINGGVHTILHEHAKL